MLGRSAVPQGVASQAWFVPEPIAATLCAFADALATLLAPRKAGSAFRVETFASAFATAPSATPGMSAKIFRAATKFALEVARQGAVVPTATALELKPARVESARTSRRAGRTLNAPPVRSASLGNALPSPVAQATRTAKIQSCSAKMDSAYPRRPVVRRTKTVQRAKSATLNRARVSHRTDASRTTNARPPNNAPKGNVCPVRVAVPTTTPVRQGSDVSTAAA